MPTESLCAETTKGLANNIPNSVQKTQFENPSTTSGMTREGPTRDTAVAGRVCVWLNGSWRTSMCAGQRLSLLHTQLPHFQCGISIPPMGLCWSIPYGMLEKNHVFFCVPTKSDEFQQQSSSNKMYLWNQSSFEREMHNNAGAHPTTTDFPPMMHHSLTITNRIIKKTPRRVRDGVVRYTKKRDECEYETTKDGHCSQAHKS
jgi:hypothetical protein